MNAIRSAIFFSVGGATTAITIHYGQGTVAASILHALMNPTFTPSYVIASLEGALILGILAFPLCYFSQLIHDRPERGRRAFRVRWD